MHGEKGTVWKKNVLQKTCSLLKLFTFWNVLAEDLSIVNRLFTRRVSIQMSSHVFYFQFKICL